MDRRHFNKLMVSGAVGFSSLTRIPKSVEAMQNQRIRLGGQLFEEYSNPEEWVKVLKKLDYKAAYCPVEIGEKDDVIKAYENAAKDADIIIAEVGAWSNPIDPDPAKAKEALDKCIHSLELAEAIGANCCVNVSGSRNLEQWAGPHEDNLTPETFDLIVEITRKIIDAVNPSRTFYSLETMPWAYPDSVESYVKLIKAIDRKGFAAHFDPVNLIVSPQVYYSNGAMIKEAFEKLGPKIRSCHAKDILLLENQPLLHLSEVRAGLGNLDYTMYLTELANFDNIPLMIEHLNSSEDYALAAEHIRNIGKENNLVI